MPLPITPPSATGLTLTPVAAASRALAPVAPVEAAAAVRPVGHDERPTRPVTPLSMSLHLMRVPASRLADVYNEMKSLVPQIDGTHDGSRGDDSPATTPALHLRA